MTPLEIRSTLDLLLNWGPIMYLPTVPFVMLGVSRGGKAIWYVEEKRREEHTLCAAVLLCCMLYAVCCMLYAACCVLCGTACAC